MKAIEINGNIKVYDPLPSSWKGVMGNFSKLSDEEIKAYGFYNVVVPKYDQRVEVLDDLYFDSTNEVFTQDVKDKTWVLTLEELKELVINNFNHEIYIKLMETDWQIVRKYETNVAVPENIAGAAVTFAWQSQSSLRYFRAFLPVCAQQASCPGR